MRYEVIHTCHYYKLKLGNSGICVNVDDFMNGNPLSDLHLAGCGGHTQEGIKYIPVCKEVGWFSASGCEG